MITPAPFFLEKKDIGTSSSSEITTLLQQISELSHEIVTVKTCLDTVQEELEEEKIHCTSLECTLELLVQQKEFVEKSLRSLNPMNMSSCWQHSRLRETGLSLQSRNLKR